MYKKASFALIILALLLAACASAAPMANAPEQPADIMSVVQRESASGVVPAAPPGNSAYAQDQTATSADRMVIKNATISIAVDDPLKSEDTISHMAEAMGGFVVSANMSQTYLQNGAKVAVQKSGV